MTNLTDEKIADLLGRITPGPWFVKSDEICYTSDADDQTFGMAVPVAVAFGSESDAEAIALVPDLLAEVARLRGALQTAMGHFDTPIARRRLGIDPNDCEWLSECRDALKPAVVAE